MPVLRETKLARWVRSNGVIKPQETIGATTTGQIITVWRNSACQNRSRRRNEISSPPWLGPGHFRPHNSGASVTFGRNTGRDYATAVGRRYSRNPAARG